MRCFSLGALFFSSLQKTNIDLACVASVSVGFSRKFRCFGPAKIGARATEESRRELGPIFARPKHQNLRGNLTRTLARQAKFDLNLFG